ncbi:MAG: replication-associated recombination protein A [Mycoplasma sp.]|nr:replication-associated recombination protein A [Mycoplasma sp.]
MEKLVDIFKPKIIEDIIGQNDIKSFISRVIKNKYLPSLILYGPPGIGKTSLAIVICNALNYKFGTFNAAVDNKQKLIKGIEDNDVLIIDEIHRLNKDKQDVLLPNIEYNNILVITTTTENPYFVINPALRSRMHILELKPITQEDIFVGVKRQLKNHDIKINITDTLLKSLINLSNSDIRKTINCLDIILKLYKDEKITKKIIENILPSVTYFSDKSGDSHYDLLSAFHKSLRGSDVDAALYYLAKLIETGDILGMERRMLAASYEDVGLANPNLPLRVKTAIDTAKKLGFPEAKLPLSAAVIDIAKAEKSNSSYLAINSAISFVKQNGSLQIPDYLKDAHYKSASKLNRGVGYKNPHFSNKKMDYLPKKIKNIKFFQPNPKDKI